MGGGTNSTWNGGNHNNPAATAAQAGALKQPDQCLHVCLLGDPGTGQTAFLRCYRSGEALSTSQPAMRTENAVVMVELDGELYGARFTDNVGNPGFESICAPALNTAHVVLLCFSVEDEATLDGIKQRWLPCLAAAESHAPTFLVGLRSDLREVKRGKSPGVNDEMGQKFAQQNNIVAYYECSALFPDTVHRIMDEALSVAKNYFTQQWQQQPPKQHATLAGSGAGGEDDAPQWLEHERLNVTDDPATLDTNTIKKNLSMLGMTITRQHAYLRVDLPELGLTSIDALRQYQHLQLVNVSKNQLRTLEPLGVLRSLLHLNASFNLLIRPESFTAPDGLETVDMSYNMIGELGDWGVHKYLRELNLRGNFINHIGPGIKHNKELRILDLSENNILSIKNMEGLDLRTLHLAQNRLDSLEGIGTLKKLQALNVRHNNITSIAALRADDIPRLRKLCIADNRISQISEVEGLASFPYLCDLLLAPNPVAGLPHYGAQVLHRLPLLRSLDTMPVPAEEKVKADLIYGADVGARREIFEQLLPEEDFVDRRLVTEEGIAEMEMERFGQYGDATQHGLLPNDGG